MVWNAQSLPINCLRSANTARSASVYPFSYTIVVTMLLPASFSRQISVVFSSSAYNRMSRVDSSRFRLFLGSTLPPSMDLLDIVIVSSDRTPLACSWVFKLLDLIILLLTVKSAFASRARPALVSANCLKLSTVVSCGIRQT